MHCIHIHLQVLLYCFQMKLYHVYFDMLYHFHFSLHSPPPICCHNSYFFSHLKSCGTKLKYLSHLLSNQTWFSSWFCLVSVYVCKICLAYSSLNFFAMQSTKQIRMIQQKEHHSIWFLMELKWKVYRFSLAKNLFWTHICFFPSHFIYIACLLLTVQ